MHMFHITQCTFLTEMCTCVQQMWQQTFMVQTVVVIMTTCSVTSDGKVGIITTLSFSVVLETSCFSPLAVWCLSDIVTCDVQGALGPFGFQTACINRIILMPTSFDSESDHANLFKITARSLLNTEYKILIRMSFAFDCFAIIFIRKRILNFLWKFVKV